MILSLGLNLDSSCLNTIGLLKQDWKNKIFGYELWVCLDKLGPVKVSALIGDGFLTALIDDFAKLSEYWHGMLLDFPDHPAPSYDRTLRSSIGCSLYCTLT